MKGIKKRMELRCANMTVENETKSVKCRKKQKGAWMPNNDC